MPSLFESHHSVHLVHVPKDAYQVAALLVQQLLDCSIIGCPQVLRDGSLVFRKPETSAVVEDVHAMGMHLVRAFKWSMIHG